MKDVFPVVTEKKARKIAARGGKVVFVHVKATCPVCDVFLPDILKPISANPKYDEIEFYQINEPLTFPVGAHPVTYFFRDGWCVQHPSGQAPKETVENLLDTIFCGKLAPLQPLKAPFLNINTDQSPPKIG
jgi:hypothetical protein